MSSKRNYVKNVIIIDTFLCLMMQNATKGAESPFRSVSPEKKALGLVMSQGEKSKVPFPIWTWIFLLSISSGYTAVLGFIEPNQPTTKLSINGRPIILELKTASNVTRTGIPTTTNGISWKGGSLNCPLYRGSSWAVIGIGFIFHDNTVIFHQKSNFDSTGFEPKSSDTSSTRSKKT